LTPTRYQLVSGSHPILRQFTQKTRNQAVARIADRTASQQTT